MNTNIIVLDTETAGGFNSPLVYDLGWVVATQDGAIIKERSYVIKEIYDNGAIFETAYYKNKRPVYEMRLKSGYCKKVSFAWAMWQLMRDMKKYGIEKFAYNSSFDNKALKSTMQALEKSAHNPIENGINDIMDYIKVITATNDYKQFCEQYGFMTAHKRPRPQKKAETLFRYLTNNPYYVEEHTALEDSKIELQILMTALSLMG